MASNRNRNNHHLKEQPGHAIQSVATTPTDSCQLAPIYPNKHHSNIPEPKMWRVKTRFVGGETIRSISRSECLNRRTVTRIVRDQDVQSHVAALKGRFYGLGDAALDAVQQALQAGDGRLGLQILTSIGAIPSVEEKRLAAIEPVAADQDKDSGIKKVMAGLASIVFERAKVYGTPLGQQLEEDLEEAGGRFDHETGQITIIDEH